MSDYIKREDAMAEFVTNGSVFVYGVDECKAIISRLQLVPSADVRENVRGEWILHIDDLSPVESTMECNQCHEHQPVTIDDNFCPNCGADMRGEL